ncbi:MAG: hypothetical protein K0S55_1160 [Clostridia bacterium]|nr:hypothetical protein [Clostridia bacterium]
MKAVIVKIKDNIAAVLSDDGCIVKIKNKNYEIGQVIEMKKANSIKMNAISKIAIAACIVFILGIGGIGTFAYMTPVTYVSLDVNPSIEYSLNMFNRVLSVKAVNEDGTEIIKNIDLDNLNNKTINEAIKTTVEEIAEEGYIAEDVLNGIVITTSAADLVKAAALAEELKEAAIEVTEENDLEVEVEVLAVGKERVEEARTLGVTPGKLNLVEKLMESASNPDEIDLNEWLQKSVKEIMFETKTNKKLAKTDNTDETENPEDAEIPEDVENPEDAEIPEGADNLIDAENLDNAENLMIASNLDDKGKTVDTGKSDDAKKPAETGKPVAADKPIDTSKPINNNKPVNADKPIDTNKPADAVKPDNSDKSTDNVKLNEEDKSNESGKSVDTFKTTESVKTTDSVKPAESVKTTEAVKPADSGKAAEPDKSKDTDKSVNKDKSTVNTNNDKNSSGKKS